MWPSFCPYFHLEKNQDNAKNNHSQSWADFLYIKVSQHYQFCMIQFKRQSFRCMQPNDTIILYLLA